LREEVFKWLLARDFCSTMKERRGKWQKNLEGPTGENRGNRVMPMRKEPLMNTDGHGFHGAEKRVSRRSFRSLFGGLRLRRIDGR